MSHEPGTEPDRGRGPAAVGVLPRALAVEALSLVDERGLLAREALDTCLAHQRRVDPRDRDLAAEILQGTLRREDTLDAVLTLRLRRPVADQDRRVLRVLRIAAYQLLFLDRVPASAVVATAVEVVRRAGRERATGLVNAVLRKVAELVGAVVQGDGDDPRRSVPRGDGTSLVLREVAFADPTADLAAHLSARYGVPPWAVRRFIAQHGADGARQVLEASIARPRIALRPRPGRGDEVEAALRAAGIEFEHEGPCLLVRGVGDVRRLPLWDAGAFAVQDPTAAEVVPSLGVREGDEVLDVCAAPGGKTLALADAVGPGGRVVAVDVPGPRTVLLVEELERRSVGNVDVLPGDATRADALPRAARVVATGAGAAGATELAGAARGFDLVLVDAPCSNSGVLARRVEARRRLRDGTALASLVLVQTNLLGAAASRVRDGGRLGWSTCSVDDDENGARVRAFLTSHPDFRLVSERSTLPVGGRRDGGYLAVLSRGGG